jgi:hypothetical protein
MKTLPLSRGLTAQVDDEDFEALNKYKWSALKGWRTFYAVRRITLPDGKQHLLLMHREILKETPPYPIAEIDHIDGNGLNNVKTNLRPCSRSENQKNKRKKRNASSQYKGVIRDKVRGKWRAEIKIDGKRVYLGRFEYEADAARAYNFAAQKHHGQFARLSKIMESNNGASA